MPPRPRPEKGSGFMKDPGSTSTRAAPETSPRASGVLDRFGRLIHYLRVSLTDQCNLRCRYCMTEDMAFRPAPELMSTDETVKLVRLFVEQGFDKIRFTGGEPTLRPDLLEIVSAVRAMPGVKTLAMTTNGIRLAPLAGPLRKAGLDRVNISIDSLNPDKFRHLTRWGRLQDALDGIRAAEEAGLTIKLNCVVVKGFNDEEDVVELARLTRSHPWQVRFIELMPFGGLPDFQRSHVVGEDVFRQRIEQAEGPLEEVHPGRLDGEARVFRWSDAPGSLGFISSVTKPFCQGCNRARLTADGILRLCLLRDRELDLLGPLRAGLSREELLTCIEDAIWMKPWGHGLARNVFATNRSMSEIGG